MDHDYMKTYGMPLLNRVDFRDKDDRVQDIVLYMLDRLQRCIKITGGSESLPTWRILQLLMQQGKGFVYPYKDKLRFLLGNVGGKPDEWYLPTEFVFANPALEWSGNIPIRDGVLWKCDSRMMGFIPLLRKYATMLVENELSLYIAEVMTRATSLIQAGHSADAEAAKAFLSDLEDGKLGVVLGQNILNGIKVQPYSTATGHLTDYIEMEQYLKASMYNELGLDANYNMKRESLNSTEAQMNTDALTPLIHDFYYNAIEACDEINDKFGEYLELGPLVVEWDSAWAINEQELDMSLEAQEAEVELVEAQVEEVEEQVEEQKENPEETTEDVDVVEEKEEVDNDDN